MKLNNFILVFIFLIISFNFIYSAAMCWNNIDCGGANIESGATFHTDYTEETADKEILCKLIGIENAEPKEFEIEIVQGQFEGGEKKWSVYINEEYSNFPFDVSFILSKATSPTYVLCHKTTPSVGTTQNPIRIATKNYWMASFDQQWFKQNAGMAEYGGYENLKNWNENNTYNNSDKNSLHITNEETATQKTNNDNRLYNILGIIVISFLIIFSYNILYLKGYKIFTLGVWLGFAFLSFIYLKNASTILAWALAIMVFYLFIIWFKENASRVMKGGFDKI